MAAQGCAIKPIKERFSNHKLVGSLLTVLAVVIACGFLFFGSYRMDWTPKEASTDAQVIEAHERLLALGYPESELNDLSDEDLLTCLRAERVASAFSRRVVSNCKNCRPMMTLVENEFIKW